MGTILKKHKAQRENKSSPGEAEVKMWRRRKGGSICKVDCGGRGRAAKTGGGGGW